MDTYHLKTIITVPLRVLSVDLIGLTLLKAKMAQS
jgi:hypothetical protein